MQLQSKRTTKNNHNCDNERNFVDFLKIKY